MFTYKTVEVPFHDLEKEINAWARQGYRLHTCVDFDGGFDLPSFKLVFERKQTVEEEYSRYKAHYNGQGQMA